MSIEGVSQIGKRTSTKSIPSDSLLDALESEVREIMGDYYAEPLKQEGRPLERP